MKEFLPIGMAIVGALTSGFFAVKGARAWRLRSIGIRTLPQLAPGDTVPVIYDPADPGHARIDTFVHGGLLGAAMGIGAGAVFLGLGLLFMTAPG